MRVNDRCVDVDRKWGMGGMGGRRAGWWPDDIIAGTGFDTGVAGSDVEIHAAGGFAGEDVGEGLGVEVMIHQGGEVLEGGAQAGADVGGVFAEGEEGAVDGAEDFAEGDVMGGTGEVIAAADAAFAVEQVGFFEDEEDLFKDFRGQPFGGRKFLDLGNGLGRPAGHGRQGTEGVFGPFGKSHHAGVIGGNRGNSKWEICGGGLVANLIF